nr:unnamed protein product [Digitaria exilis]
MSRVRSPDATETSGRPAKLGIEAARRESAEGEVGRTRRRRDGSTGEPEAAARREERTPSLWR